MAKLIPAYTILLNLTFIFLISCLSSTHLHSSNSQTTSPNHNNKMNTDNGCKHIQTPQNNQAKCSYIKSHEACKSRGHIPYLHLFYCKLTPFLGYFSLTLWLILIFYLLGDTASNYFCYSLTGLSKTLKLSPTIAGISLLSLGNGAPDVFSSVISFTSDDTSDIGLNSILGGAFFVSSLVVGIVSISVRNHGIIINKLSFIKNVVFLLMSVSFILLIIIIGKISLWGALCFLCFYLIYMIIVLAPGTCSEEVKTDRSDDLEAPFLHNRTDEIELPRSCLNKILSILELPLELPRKLTIPVVAEGKWSKPIGVTSVTLAPITLALIWDYYNIKNSNLMTLKISGLIGISSGIVAFCTTEKSNPPRKCLILWLGLGFIMSITWTYILAQELISLLVSMGLILGIDNSILGLTVLAWGNSIGDLVANVAMAVRSGPDGAQLAIYGSYAGPIFNTVVGLGLSLVFSAWTNYPASYAICVDHSVFVTIGFFIVGLVWALVIVPKRRMRIDEWLGIGLLVIYMCFLFLQIAIKFGY